MTREAVKTAARDRQWSIPNVRPHDLSDAVRAAGTSQAHWTCERIIVPFSGNNDGGAHIVGVYDSNDEREAGNTVRDPSESDRLHFKPDAGNS